MLQDSNDMIWDCNTMIVKCYAMPDICCKKMLELKVTRSRIIYYSFVVKYYK